jgi:DNA-binding response OmpR family regulator
MAILVADPDSAMLDVLQYALRRDNFDALLARDGVEALALWHVQQPELVLLETRLPGLDGWEVCKRIRSERSTPIMFLTFDDEPSAIIRGLDLGADDYVTKPFDPWQLLARIRAVLPRSHASRDMAGAAEAPLVHGDPTLAAQSRTVRRNGGRVQFTVSEFALLMDLIHHEGEVLTPHALFSQVVDSSALNERCAVEKCIAALRHKLEPDPAHPTYILTVVGSGYTFHRPYHQGL